MKMFDKISYQPVIVFIIVLKDLIEILKKVTKMEPGILTINLNNIDWTNIISDLVIVLYLFWILRGLKRFSRAVIDNTHAQANLNELLLKQEDNQNITGQYINDLDAIKKYRPYSEKELNDLYLFDPNNPHKNNNLKYEPNRDQQQVPDRTGSNKVL